MSVDVAVDCRSTLDRHSVASRSTVDRLSTATSTDIAVDITVDITYSKHDMSVRPVSNVELYMCRI